MGWGGNERRAGRKNDYRIAGYLLQAIQKAVLCKVRHVRMEDGERVGYLTKGMAKGSFSRGLGCVWSEEAWAYVGKIKVSIHLTDRRWPFCLYMPAWSITYCTFFVLLACACWMGYVCAV